MSCNREVVDLCNISAGRVEVKFDNNCTTCDIGLKFGRLGPWEVLHLCTKFQYNVMSSSVVIKIYLHCPSSDFNIGLHCCCPDNPSFGMSPTVDL